MSTTGPGPHQVHEVGTGAVSVLVLDEDHFPDMPDVAPANVATMLWVVRNFLAPASKRSADELEEALFAGLLDDWSAFRVQHELMPLNVYKIMERNLATMLGDPSRLYEAAQRGSLKSGFGVVNNLAFTMLRVISFLVLPWISHPGILFAHIIPIASGMFNANKVIEAVAVNWQRAVLRTKPAKVAGLVLRKAASDIFSRLWWAPGFTAAPVRYWFRQCSVRHLIIDVDPRQVWLACADFIQPHLRVEEAEDELTLVTTSFDRTAFARRIKLYREPVEGNGGYYTISDPMLATNLDDYRSGWLIIRDVSVPTPGEDSHSWTIFSFGQVYCAEAGCGLTEYAYRPPWWQMPFVGLTMVLGLVLRPALWALLWVIRKFIQYIARENFFKWLIAKSEAEEVSRKRLWLELFQDGETAARVTTGSVSRIAVSNAVIVMYDGIGYSARCNVLPDEDALRMMEPLWAAIADYEVDPRVARGELPAHLGPGDVSVQFLNETGDGGIVQFSGDVPTRMLVELAVQFASYLHDAAEHTHIAQLPAMELRIAITEGHAIRQYMGRRLNPKDPTDQRRIGARQFVFSRAIIRGARLMAHSKLLARRLSEQTGNMPHRLTVVERDLFRLGEHVGVAIELLGSQQVRDIAEAIDLLRVVDGKANTVQWPEEVLKLE